MVYWRREFLVSLPPYAAQPRAERAISQAKKILIQDHIDHCLQDAVGELDEDRQRAADEFKEITKYL